MASPSCDGRDSGSDLCVAESVPETKLGKTSGPTKGGKKSPQNAPLVSSGPELIFECDGDDARRDEDEEYCHKMAPDQDPSWECRTSNVATVTVQPPPCFSLPDSSTDSGGGGGGPCCGVVGRAGSSPVDPCASCNSFALDAATTGGSLASSINDLSFEAEQLDRAIRHNDTGFVRRMLELHHGRFPVNLHGSMLDKSSDGSQSHCVSQDVEILLRKSQTFLDRLDRHESLSSDHDSPPIFANALHLAVEYNSLDVARLLLKYGVDPNEVGIPLTSLEVWRRGSCSAASEGNISPLEKGRRFSHLLTPGMARFVATSISSNHSDTSNGGSSPAASNSAKVYVTSRSSLDSPLRTVYVTSEGRAIGYDEEYTRDTLYTLAPLFLAVAVGNAAMVHLLLKYGSDPNVQDRHGVAPLHLATCQERVSWSCVRLLLERGAKIGLQNHHRVSPCQLLDQDLRTMQSSLVEDAFACFLPSAAPSVSVLGEESFMTGAYLRSNFLRRLQDNKSQSRQSSKNKEYLSVDEAPRGSPEGISFSSHPESLRSRHSIKSVQSVGVVHVEDDKMTEHSDKMVAGDGPSGGDISQHPRTSVRRSKDESRYKGRSHTPSTSEASELRVSRAELNLHVLTKMATNTECLMPVLNSLQRHLQAVIELTDHVNGHRLHKPVAALLNQLMQTTMEEFSQAERDQHRQSLDPLSIRLCLLLRVAVMCLRGGQSLQYSALLLVNKAIDTCVAHRVALRPVPRTEVSAEPYCPAKPEDGREQVPLVTTVPSATCIPWRVPRAVTSFEIAEVTSGVRWWSYYGRRQSQKSQHSTDEGGKQAEAGGKVATSLATQPESETVLGILAESGVDLILNVLNNGITLHKRVVGTRHHCTPSHRWRHCSYHCLQILSARAILYSSQLEEVQRKLMEEAHLKILVAALDSTHDPQLLCLVLQVVATLALNPVNHPQLLDADIPDCLTQLVLPSDEWYYTNHSTKYARYVKHHAARVLVYLGQELRLRAKVNLFELLEDPLPLPTPLTTSQEDTYIIQTSMASPTVNDVTNCLLGASLEAIVLEMLRDMERKLRLGESSSEDQMDQVVINKGPSITVDPSEAHLDFPFFLMALPIVTHPVVLLRLLQHRFLCGMVQRQWQSTTSRSSVASGENRSRASSAGNEDSLRARRKVNLTINCSTPSLSPVHVDISERRSSLKGATDTRVVIQTSGPIASLTVTVGAQQFVQREKCTVVTSAVQPDKATPTSKDGTPSSSPLAHHKRAFRFSSLRKKRHKLQNETSFSSSQSDERNTSEADIVAFQRELQNLPNFDSQPNAPFYLRDLMEPHEPVYARPRSCSVPRVTFDTTSLQLPHSHGPLIRSATTEGTYPSSISRSPASLSPGKVPYAPDSPTPGAGDLPATQRAVLKLLQEWGQMCRQDITHSPTLCRELREFLVKISCLSDQYQWWVEELKIAFDLQENENGVGQQDDQEAVDKEYEKLQRLVVSGDLPCSKEEAAILAGIQLRIEETWPSSNKLTNHSSGDQRLKLRPITEDVKETLAPESATTGSKLTSLESPEELEDQQTEHADPPLLSLNNAVLRVSKSTAILRNWMTSNGNKAALMATTSLSLEDCLPPMYRNAKNMAKCIKEQKRKLFHSPVYDSELHLKKLYIQSCKRLPAYGCRVFQVKETLRGKTKKKATRLLGIGLEKLVLLDSKTLLPTKSQPTADLQQWRTGGGRSHDQLVLEFRATKWSFIASSQGALRSISTELWEVMQDLDAHFLEDHIIATREEMENEIRKSLILNHGLERSTLYKDELETLQSLLHFPENVAFLLTDVEYDLFYKVNPIHYVRQVTLDLSQCRNTSTQSTTDFTVQALVKRFNEVSSWVTHIIISQPTHDDRKAVLSCILRVAITCWNLGNFNTAMEILAGLKSEKLKPFWLSLTDKDHVTTLEMLTKALLTPDLSAEYRAAVDRALATPHSKVIPFFGSFLRELRAVLKGVPSLVVLSAGENTKLEFVSDYHGEDHFFTRIGVGGIINVDKLRRTHQVLEDIQAFHDHAARRSQAAEDDVERTEGRDEEDEEESLYEMETDSYHSIHPGYNDPGISFFHISYRSRDYQTLQNLHHGTTVVHWDEDGSRSSLVYLRLERSNATLTWSKPAWSALRGGGAQDYSLGTNIDEPVSPGLLIKYETSDVAHNSLEEGFLDLASVKEVVLGRGTVDLGVVSRRYGLEDLHPDQNCLRLMYGINLSDNRNLEFVAPTLVAETWYQGLLHVVNALKQQKQLSDRRIYWLKEKYLQLFFDDLACCGPTPAEAIKVFGGRKWTLGSLGGSCSSMDTSGSGFKRVSSFGVGTGKLRKKKSSSSLAAIRDCSPKSQSSAASDTLSDIPFRRQSPSIKLKRSCIKSTPQLPNHGGEQLEECLSPGTPNGTSLNGTGSSYSVNTVTGLTSSVIPSASLSSGYRERCRQFTSGGSDSSPPLVCGPAITHSSQMDFLQFAELFRSFLVRSRKDLRNLFEQVAVSSKSLAETPMHEGQGFIITPGIGGSGRVLGLLTRNTPFDYVDNNQRKKICDAIAAASIVSNSAGVDTSKTLVLGLVDFQQFLAVHQGEQLTETEVTTLIQRHEPDPALRSRPCLSFEGFARYLMDKDNYAFVSETVKPKEEDMEQPLSHYFIASSHNTYLTGHQLKGESSVELYSQVLLTGCRCVELDCWDGDDGMPVIYHGHTLTTKIPFKSVVDAINKSAFVTSPYPVILSIENHCSLQQQAKMAQIFMMVFGDRLVTRFLFDSDYGDDPQLPSPNQLKYRVLIKNKKMRATMTPALPLKSRCKPTSGRTNSIISTTSTGSFNDEDDDEYEDDDDDDDILEESFHPSVVIDQEDQQSSGTVSKSASLTVRTESVSSQEGSCKDKALSPGPLISSNPSVPSKLYSQTDMAADIIAEEDKSRKSSSQIAPELSDLVIYCQAIKFRGFVTNASPTNSVKIKKMSSKKNLLATSSNASTPSTPPLQIDPKPELPSSKRPAVAAPCYQVSSVNESTAKKLCKRHPLALMTHCESQLMRTYPAGMRIDSSNFNPVIFWSFGIQMVALNYQTEDSALHVNTAMFEQTGRCGYVLKPRVMWDRSHMMYGRFNPWDKTFDGLHALSLTITVISGQYVCPTTHTGSPQVEVEILGIPVDCNRPKTKLVQRNSLNPIWNDSFHFRVTFSDLAFIRFSVMDMGTNHVTAQRVIPLTSLRQGYRHVRLRNSQNQALPLSTLFICSTWEEEGLEMPHANGDIYDGTCGGKKMKGKVRETTTTETSKNEVKEVIPGSVPVKRRMFFLMVHGVIPDEPSTILKITQESTTREVITQALSKTNNSSDCVDDYVLIEEVHRGWEKKLSEKSTIQRFLDPEERPLEAQAQWQGEGRFILKKLADDPSTRAWMTTIRSTASKEKRRQDGLELSGDELHDWADGEEVFLVCVYNVSPDQPYAILKAPVSSTAQDILAQALIKARRMEDPSKFILVEEVEYPPLAESTPSGTIRRRGIHRERRTLDDHENVFQAQQRWKAKGWFELREKELVSTEKKKLTATRSSTLGKLSRLRGSSKSTKGKPPLTPDRRVKSLNESSGDDVRVPWRQVHSEGEIISDDEVKETTVMKLKRISLRRLKVWR